jgi:nucleoside-diphosphate-sugar epimerase
LIKKLVAKDIEVMAIDISFADSHLPEDNNIIKIELSLNDAASLLNRLPTAEYDAFYHFAWAGVNGDKKADPVVQLENAKMAMNCAIAAKNLGCKKFLCAGTVAEQSVNSLNNLSKTSGGMMYGVAKHCTHLMLETYCKNIDQDFIWMQFSNIYGPNNKTGNLVSYTIEQLKNGNEATFGPAAQPYDFIYVDDLLEAIFRLGENGTDKNYYFIGSGEPRILKDYLLEIGEACEHPELIKIGIRPDDGISYSIDMFDIKPLIKAIGNYVSVDFSQGIKNTTKVQLNTIGGGITQLISQCNELFLSLLKNINTDIVLCLTYKGRKSDNGKMLRCVGELLESVA